MPKLLCALRLSLWLPDMFSHNSIHIITSLTGAAILYFSAKKLGTRITGFFDFRYLIRLLAENIAAVTVLACLRNLLESARLNNLLILLLICSTYYVILLALNKKRLIVNLKEIG